MSRSSGVLGDRQKLEFSFRHVEFEISIKHPGRNVEYTGVEDIKLDSKRQVKAASMCMVFKFMKLNAITKEECINRAEKRSKN